MILPFMFSHLSPSWRKARSHPTSSDHSNIWIKVKVLTLLKYHTRKIYGELEVGLQVFLTTKRGTEKYLSSHADRCVTEATAPDQILPSSGVDMRRKIVLYRHFGTNYRSYLEGSFFWTTWPFKMVLTGSPETSVSNNLTRWNNSEDGRIHFNCDGSLRLRRGTKLFEFQSWPGSCRKNAFAPA
jgi:hypothetical protein